MQVLLFSPKLPVAFLLALADNSPELSTTNFGDSTLLILVPACVVFLLILLVAALLLILLLVAALLYSGGCSPTALFHWICAYCLMLLR